MKTCDDVGRFVAGGLPVERCDAFRAHLPDCDSCQREVHALMQLVMLLPELPNWWWRWSWLWMRWEVRSARGRSS